MIKMIKRIYTVSTLSLMLVYVDLGRADMQAGKCAGKDVDLSESQITNIKECLKVVGVDQVHELGIENGGCFFKCTMEKKGVIDAAGVSHLDKLNDFVDIDIPINVKNLIKKDLEACFTGDDAKGLKMKGDDGTCSTFLPLAMCVHMCYLEHC